MDRELTQVDKCIYMDDEGRTYFCIGDFLRVNPQLPKDERFQQVIASEVKDMWPDMLILEEQS